MTKFKISYLTKFTFSNSYFSQDSHFQSLFFHKILFYFVFKVLLLGIILPCISSDSLSYSRFQLGNGPLIETKIGHGPPRRNHLQQKRRIHPIQLKEFLKDREISPEPTSYPIEVTSLFLPTPQSQTTSKPKTFSPLLSVPTYKPNPEPLGPFKPSPKLHNLRYRK